MSSLAGIAVAQNAGLKTQAPQHPATDAAPNFPPSYTLHVSPSQTEGTRDFGGPNFRSLEGFDLKSVISLLYGVNPIRIELPTSLDADQRYDFSMVLPDREDGQKIIERFQRGIQDYFHITATPENRLMQVYVVTAPGEKKPPALNAQTEAGGGIFSSFTGFDSYVVALDKQTNARTAPKVFSLDAVNSIMVEGTADQFCKTLEHSLDLPIVNETNLQGRFAFHIEANQTSKNDFLDRLQDQLGLIIEPAQRNVEMLVFKAR